MSAGTSSFAATRWTLVQRSRGDGTPAAAALCDLCAAYYTPVVAFLRREGRPEDAARDLAHAFFARILAGGAIEGAEAERGRFRNYLLGALKHFLADQRDQAATARRGGGTIAVAWHPADAETGDASGPGLRIADERAESPAHAFDRQWALTVLQRALSALETDLTAEGRSLHFAVLKPWLTGDTAAHRQAEAAAALTISVDAAKTAIHRLRKRFRACVKAEIANTLADPAQVGEEMECLIAALR